MGLMQQAYDTYCAMESQYAGIYARRRSHWFLFRTKS